MAAIPQKAGDWGMNVEDDLPKTANVGKGMASAFHKVAQLPNHAHVQGEMPIKHPHGEVKEAVGKTREEVRAEGFSVESPLIKLHCQD